MNYQLLGYKIRLLLQNMNTLNYKKLNRSSKLCIGGHVGPIKRCFRYLVLFLKKGLFFSNSSVSYFKEMHPSRAFFI